MTDMEKVHKILDLAQVRFVMEVDPLQLKNHLITQGILTYPQVIRSFHEKNTSDQIKESIMHHLRLSPLISYLKMRILLKHFGYVDFVHECLPPVGDLELSNKSAIEGFVSPSAIKVPHLSEPLQNSFASLALQNEIEEDLKVWKTATVAGLEVASDLINFESKKDNDNERVHLQQQERISFEATFYMPGMQRKSQPNTVCSLTFSNMDQYGDLFLSKVACRKIEVNCKKILAVTQLLDKVFVIGELQGLPHTCSPTILVFDVVTSGEFRQTNDIILMETKMTLWDISACQKRKCLYAFDSDNWCIWAMRLISTSLIEFKLSKPELVVTLTDKEMINLSVTVGGDLLVLSDSTKTLKVIQPVPYMEKNICLPTDMIYLQHAIETLVDGMKTYMISYGHGNIFKHGVCQVNDTGQVIRSFGNERGSGNSTVDSPNHMVIDNERNELYVCDDKRVLVLDLKSCRNRQMLSKYQIRPISGRPTRMHCYIGFGLIIGLDNGRMITFPNQKTVT